MECPEGDSHCVLSWIKKSSFDNSSISSKYIFALYWIFETITTVGYGDYTGATTHE
jgi:hypothetical protein